MEKINFNDILIPVIAIMILLALLTAFIIYFVLLYRKKQNDFEQEKQALNLALLTAEDEIKTQTLKDISRELHDNLGQIASLIKINLNLLQKIDNDIEHTQKLKETKVLTQQLITDIRSIAQSLNYDDSQNLNLQLMIDHHITQIKKTKTVKVNYETYGNIPKLENETTIFLFRIIQESITNIIRHAQADELGLILTYDSTIFSILISDNGRGFDKDKITYGSGLKNLTYRCQIIGAQLNIDSLPGKGTTISVKLKIS